jgi:hypothetical protein
LTYVVLVFSNQMLLLQRLRIWGSFVETSPSKNVLYCKGQNSLGRNYHYSIENDHNFIAQKTSNTGVGFVHLFERRDKPWMNGRVRCMNLQLDQTLMRHDMSHIGVTDTPSIAREDCTMRGLHQNS